jgi:FkbM family methyltransferase
MNESRVIFDVGANNGDDVPYYLHKANVVVAIEANPALCDYMQTRFASEIRCGRLFVVNCVATEKTAQEPVEFYIHKTHHVLSSFVAPPPQRRNEYGCVRLRSRSIVDLVSQFGIPHYLKLDIEGYDSHLLRALFAESIFPDYLSAECSSFEPLVLMAAIGSYHAFKLVDGWSVARTYRDRQITSLGLRIRVPYSFPRHSAGPFGEDIDGPWMALDEAAIRLAVGGFGWRDLHATRLVPSPTNQKPDIFFPAQVLAQRVRRLLSQRLRRLALLGD